MTALVLTPVVTEETEIAVVEVEEVVEVVVIVVENQVTLLGMVSY